MNVYLEQDIALSPNTDPQVIKLRSAVTAARAALEPAAKAWADYCDAHRDDLNAVPFSRQKQRVFDRFCDASWDVDEAEAALAPVLTAATKRATEAWNEKIRQEFLDDVPTIDAFIELLARYEQTVIAAELAGCSGVLSVGQSFLSADEVATRLAYAKKALGLES